MKSLLLPFLLFLASAAPGLAQTPGPSAQPLAFRNPDLPVAKRIDDLIGRLTIDEKISQMMMNSPAIPRLDIPAYAWWNEALHGVARKGRATVFPQAIALAATWNPALHHRIADAISTEVWAKTNELASRPGGKNSQFLGLTLWSPNINIFRDPRWGRGQETYGEDPFLTGRFAVAFVTGLQGDDPHYLKTVATLKHFAVHSGPESLRHQFNAVVSERDLHETYLPAFETGVREGHAWSLMSAYNAIDGIPAPANTRLLTDILRDDWGFPGAVVGDVDTVSDITRGHHYTKDAAEASALAVKAGTDLCSGATYKALPDSLKRGLCTEADIDAALRRLLLLRFKLGQFDPPDRVPFTKIPASDNDSPAHEQLALEASRQSLVLLKNDGALPWDVKTIKTLAVIGPTAADNQALVGNYNGTPARPVTLIKGLRDRLEPLGVKIIQEPGVPLVTGFHDKSQMLKFGWQTPDPGAGTDRALAAAKQADHILLTLGITPALEGEEMRVNAEGFSGGDRTSILLPKCQRDLIDKIAALGKSFVVVLTNGSALSFDVSKPNAILDAWYYGEQGGNALTEALLGDYNPAGRLPITFYQSDSDLPPFTDYSMVNRTYRYFAGKPLYAFGHGLSYTTFAYEKAALSAPQATAGQTVTLRVTVKNSGSRSGDEVIQAYAHAANPPVPMPLRQLVGFLRVSFQPGETKDVEIPIPVDLLRRWDETKKSYVVDPGAYELRIGPSSDQPLLTATLQIPQ
jgi:beta-glucosidase